MRRIGIVGKRGIRRKVRRTKKKKECRKRICRKKRRRWKIGGEER
jgi:hypothetical protein